MSYQTLPDSVGMYSLVYPMDARTSGAPVDTNKEVRNDVEPTLQQISIDSILKYVASYLSVSQHT
jgi:hypothetical protein